MRSGLHNPIQINARTLQASLLFAACAIMFVAVAINPFTARAQSSEGWSNPAHLSSLDGNAGLAYMLSDDTGQVYAFWSASKFDSDRSLIYFSHFNGRSWTDPVDVYASWPGTSIKSVSAAIDPEGVVHLVWSEGQGGPVYHSSAPLESADTVGAWSTPISLGFPGYLVDLKSDQDGLLHLVYLSTDQSAPGIYYSLSENGGRLWTYPVRIDQEMPTTAVPDKVELAVDGSSGLHVVWSYTDDTSGSQLGRYVGYSHKLPSDEAWSEPMTVDSAKFGEQFTYIPYPSIAASGSEIHIIWGATHDRQPDAATVNRFDLVSEDRGLTWSDPAPVFGSLEGQALGDGLAVDSAGHLHFVSQLRWPQAIWHSVWDGTEWSEPSMIYLIREDATDDFRDRIHAHGVRIAIFGGSHLVVTFTPPPLSVQSVLYEMHEIVPNSELGSTVATADAIGPPKIPTSAATLTSLPTSTATVTPRPTFGAGPTGNGGDGVILDPILMGILPVTLFLLWFVVGQAYRRK